MPGVKACYRRSGPEECQVKLTASAVGQAGRSLEEKLNVKTRACACGLDLRKVNPYLLSHPSGAGRRTRRAQEEASANGGRARSAKSLRREEGRLRRLPW